MALFKTPVKKKQRKNQKLYLPLPIPCNNSNAEEANSKWSYYHGELANNHVVIKNSGDAFDLTHHGCFGKLFNKQKCLKLSKTNESSIVSVNNDASFSDNLLDINMGAVTAPICDDILQADDILDLTLEKLHLSLFESFFLSYGIGCLFIKNSSTGDIMTISEQWSCFCSKCPYFPLHYAVYHHFRSKGWVPKDGIRYGADFLLYRKGPPYFHASYIVVVCYVNAETLKPVHFDGLENRQFSWETLTGLLRLATTVSKEIMFCYVGIPSGISSISNLTLDNLKNFTIYENIASRWVSSKEREKELLDVDCDF